MSEQENINQEQSNEQNIENSVEPVENSAVVDGVEQGETPEGEEHQAPKESRVQKRIDKLTREKYELKGKLEAYERMMSQQQVQVANVESKPQRSQFGSDEEFIDAITDYKINQRENASKQQSAVAAQTSVESAWAAKEKSAMKEYEDYSDVVEDASDVKINSAAVEAILESDLGPDIRYYLAKNPDEAEKTLSMSASAAIKHIGKIEAKIEAQKSAKKTKTSSAPPPIKPVKAGGSSSKDDYYGDDDSWWKKTLAEKRKK